MRVDAGAGLNARSAVKHLRVQVEGPVPVLREAEAGRDIAGLEAVVTLPAGLKPGRHAVHFSLATPEGFRVLSRLPETIEIIVRK